VSPPTLSEVQSVLLRLIRAPEGVEKAVAELDASGNGVAAAVGRWIVGDERLSAHARLDVYANMYFYRLKDVLEQEFERTARLLGEVGFHNLVTDFLLAHPSHSPSIRWVSRPFPAYLAAHSASGDFPAAADLASIEWAWWDSFQAADAEPLAAEELAAVPEDRWADLVLRPVPAFHLLRVRRDSLALWRGERPGIDPSPVSVAVSRARFSPAVAELGDREALALFRLAAGEAVGEVAAALAGDDSDDASVVEAVLELAGYLREGIGRGDFAGPVS